MMRTKCLHCGECIHHPGPNPGDAIFCLCGNVLLYTREGWREPTAAEMVQLRFDAGLAISILRVRNGRN